MPSSVILSLVFVFGAVIGSFLNVVIYRLHTGKSINARSHCLSCGCSLRWYELFPLVSYLLLYGRCGHCRAGIPSRYFLVELLTGLSFVMVWQFTQHPFLLLLLLVLVAVLIVGMVYDLYHMIIPDEIVILVSVLAVTHLLWRHWPDWGALGTAISAGGLAFLWYGGLWYYSKGRWIGFGDAKLALPLATFLTPLGAFSLIVWSFWIGAVVSLLILGFQQLFNRGQIPLRFWSGPLKMKSEIPFAPFLVIAFVFVYFFNLDVLSLTSYAIESLYNQI